MNAVVLAIDVGNTHTVLGVFAGERLLCHWRLKTNRQRTADEYGFYLDALLRARGIRRVERVAISSVVPPVTAVLQVCSATFLEVAAHVITADDLSDLPIRYDDPRQLGTDRLANAVAAYERTRAATIVVDCGTATKFEWVDADGAYCGGAIAPGLGIASDALFARAARLYRVPLAWPAQVVGRNTVNALQSGFLHGHAALVDGMVARMQREMGARARVVATGGYAPLLAPYCRSVDEVVEFLTLEGIRLIASRRESSRTAQPLDQSPQM
jgi:type III pantothenate kinase